MDRLMGAYAAVRLFSQVRLILDFGTAITLDFVSTKKVYQGGIILPGIGSTQRVLSKCSLLPKKIIYKPGYFIASRSICSLFISIISILL